MKKTKQGILTLISIAAIVIAIFSIIRAPGAVVEESTFDRITKEDNMAVCYVVWPPSISKDPNTGELSGFLIEIAEEIAKDASLELEYVESTWGGFPADLNAGRCDAAIAGIYPMIGRSTSVSFTRPFFFAGYDVVVKSDDNKFKTVDDLNSEDVKIAVIQGEFGQIFAKKFLPKAQLVELEKSSDLVMPLLAVSSGQADAGFSQTDVITNYIETDSTIRKLVPDKPYATIPVTWSVRTKDQELLNFLDNGITYLKHTGFLEETAKKHSPPGWFSIEPEYKELS